MTVSVKGILPCILRVLLVSSARSKRENPPRSPHENHSPPDLPLPSREREPVRKWPFIGRGAFPLLHFLLPPGEENRGKDLL